MEWIEGINRALALIEENLDGEIDAAAVAKAAGFSPFYFQRMFAMMTNQSLGEYIRKRRLSMAGQELQCTRAKVIDIALKYGYESPESFQKAFRRFHGITPSAARQTRVQLRYLNPLQIQVQLKGGSMMDYTVENMQELWVMGRERTFTYDSAFREIPLFWDEYVRSGACGQVPGYLGACFDNEPTSTDGMTFRYLIGCFCAPNEAEVSEGYVLRSLGKHTWVKFRTCGAIPDALQKLNRRIFTEWLPGNTQYEVDGTGMNIEVYGEGNPQAADYETQIWLPVRAKA